MTIEPSADRPPRGRPRSEESRQAILQATRDLLGEVGYARLTIEEVAERAGAGKSTIYRWWPTKGELALEAAEEHIAIGLVPSTGDTRRDLHIAVDQLVGTFADPLAAIVIFAAIATLEHDPLMARAFRDGYVYPWRRSAAQAIQRGIDRGDLPAESDVSFILDVIVGTVFQRTLILREADTGELAEKIGDLIMPPT
jgi:AcrR family transcriptional regulator